MASENSTVRPFSGCGSMQSVVERKSREDSQRLPKPKNARHKARSKCTPINLLTALEAHDGIKLLAGDRPFILQDDPGGVFITFREQQSFARHHRQTYLFTSFHAPQMHKQGQLTSRQAEHRHSQAQYRSRACWTGLSSSKYKSRVTAYLQAQHAMQSC